MGWINFFTVTAKPRQQEKSPSYLLAPQMCSPLRYPNWPKSSLEHPTFAACSRVQSNATCPAAPLMARCAKNDCYTSAMQSWDL